jgi:hypothetical protein
MDTGSVNQVELPQREEFVELQRLALLVLRHSNLSNNMGLHFYWMDVYLACAVELAKQLPILH